MNKLLIFEKNNRYDAVAYLETDVGQCEFTPSGLISLHIISEPVFGRDYYNS